MILHDAHAARAFWSAGAAARQPARPARAPRGGRRPAFDEYDEDEIEAALHGDDYLEDDFDEAEAEDEDEV